MGGLVNCIGHYGGLGLPVGSVFKAGFTKSLVYQSLDAAVLDSILLVVTGVSGKSHDPAGSGHLAQFCMRVIFYSFYVLGLQLIY
jgi:hypothetical protein